jgi:hypothetical protein
MELLRELLGHLEKRRASRALYALKILAGFS